jgi:hypothetical protein
MAHSIELLLDPRTDTAIRAAWQALADAGLPSQVNVKSSTNRPHITLLAAERISPDVDEVLRGLAPRLPLACVVGAHVVFGGPVFGGSSLTLARLIVPSADFLALHAEVYRLALPFVTGQPFPQCRPGHWTAHATLGRRLTGTEVGAALGLAEEVAADFMTSDLMAEVVALRRWDSDARTDHLLIG